MSPLSSNSPLFFSALLVSLAVHLPIYGGLGLLSGDATGDRLRLSVQITDFELADSIEESWTVDEPQPVKIEESEKPRRFLSARRDEPAGQSETVPSETPEAIDEIESQPEEPSGAVLPTAGSEATVEARESAGLPVSVEAGTEGEIAVAGLPGNGSTGNAALGLAGGGTARGKATAGQGRGQGGGGDFRAVPLVRVEPRYPFTAARRGIQGWVRLRFDINPSGKVDNPVVIDSRPPGVFEETVLQAIKRWKYRPAIEDGVAVSRKGVQVRLTFRLD